MKYYMDVTLKMSNAKPTSCYMNLCVMLQKENTPILFEFHTVIVFCVRKPTLVTKAVSCTKLKQIRY